MKIKAVLPIIAAALLGAALLWLVLMPRARSAKRPNLLLITLDTTRLDHLSCYGYGRRTTPCIDRLASEGRRYENAVAVSSWTLPTHASLFTGLYPATHGAHYAEEGQVALDDAIEDPEKLYGGFRANALSGEAVTLAEALKKAGYATGGIGAGPWLKEVFGLSQGFDEYDCEVHSTAGRRADEVNALAVPFLRRNRDRPFFLFLNYFDPHAPWDPPAEFRFRFFPQERLEDVSRDPSVAAAYDISQYDAEIFYMDREIGRLLDILRKMDLYDSTWIIVVGDHGELLGEHGLWFHGFSLFEGEVRCPLIMKWPAGLEPSASIDGACQQVDVMPTVLERLGLAPPPRMQGQPLGEVTHPVVCQLYRNPGNIKLFGPRFDRRLRAVYSGSFKWIQSSKEGDPDAGLYDLSADADESTDLAAAKPGKARELEDLLERWEAALGPALTPRRIESLDPKTEKQLKEMGYGH